MNLAFVEDAFAILSAPVGVSVYDFDFELYFRCTHPPQFEPGTPAILRIGAVEDYDAQYREALDWGLRLVNSPDEYRRASELEAWYPLLADMTPRTLVFDRLPSVETVEREFSWPIFLKGSRQTNRHCADMSVIRDPAQYRWAAERYRNDPVLHWQKAAIREFVDLVPVNGSMPGKVRASFEFRSFWWQGRCVGWGRYWYQAVDYGCDDIEAGLEMAHEAAARLAVPFLVVDFAKTVDGRWIVIECNDAQESGYAAARPRELWTNLLDRMREAPA